LLFFKILSVFSKAKKTSRIISIMFLVIYNRFYVLISSVFQIILIKASSSFLYSDSLQKRLIPTFCINIQWKLFVSHSHYFTSIFKSLISSSCFLQSIVFFLLVITLISFIDDSCQNNTNYQIKECDGRSIPRLRTVKE
jgi:hypothetical protein